MDTSHIIELIVIIVLVVLSAFFSASETAFSMASMIKLKSMSEEGHKGAVTAMKILDNPKKMLSTVLVGNNIVNIASSSIATTLFIALLGSSGASVATIILTVVLLIFGEITPKTLASGNPERFACAVAPVIRMLTIVLTPIVFIINVLAGLFIKILTRGKNNDKSAMTESELRALLDVSSEEGVIETNEKDIINNLIDFGDSIAKDIMTPRANIVSIDINAALDEVIDTYKEYKHSRVPVYKDNPNNIVGILHSKDILMFNTKRDPELNEKFSVSDIMRKAYYTFEMQNNSALFKDMQKQRTSIAVVIDEYDKSAMTESELRALLDVSSEEGVIETNEKDIINNLIDFGDSIAKDIMTPRANIVSIDINAALDEVIDTYKEYKHSRVPVYKDNPNNIVGILHSKDILMFNTKRDPELNEKFSVSDIMRKAYYTFEMQNNSALFKDMQKQRTSIAVVIDEYGEFAGIITTQDLLEEIIGKIHDEYDEKSKDSCIQVSPNIYKVEGSLKLDDLNDFIGSDLTSEENDSVAGLVIEKLDRFPVAGDSITVNDLYITVIKTERNRVETVLVKKIIRDNPPEEEKEAEK